MPILTELAEKYNVPTPRYTSYPTVPSWIEGIDSKHWLDTFSRQFGEENHRRGISLYIHLPFCESLCIYCGCTKKITCNHSVEERYIQAILKEWGLYLGYMPEKPVIRELHLGGGTPTFFSPERLTQLVQGILENASVHPDYSFSFEGHPNNTTRQHLQALYGLGFRRVSYGIQDTNPTVQNLIHRIQPFENVVRAVDEAREIGFTSVNFDLVYGLPGQDADKMIRSISQSLTLGPDRVAFYSYAHTPKMIPSQRLIDPQRLVSPSDKLAMYLAGKSLFTGQGYTDIGMDHFSLPTDDLYRAYKNGTLHRNFMGYTTQNSLVLLGLGMSAISDTGNAYAQNNKSLAGYYKAVESGQPAVNKGYFLSDEDLAFRRHILDIACQGTTKWNHMYRAAIEQFAIPSLRSLEKDGLVSVGQERLQVTPLGRHFIRNICKAFDLHLARKEKAAGEPAAHFSKAI
jgi:oxygen-independent coproporphyrinogen-3 oxidase